jgi:predicted amidohydrolase YtcJ
LALIEENSVKSPPIRGVLLCAVLLLAACQPQAPEVPAADLVLRGGVVHTVNPLQPIAQAIAVTGTEIVFVGTDKDAEAHIGPSTEVVELDGHLLMPGLVDAHVHPIGGAIKNLYQCNFPFSADPDEVQATVAKCVEDRPDAEWIIGGQWDSGFFDRFDLPSPRSWIDEVSANVAVYLVDDSGHNGWVNSKALELAGVTAETPDPEGGTVGREENGVPNGILIETAQGLVRDSIPSYSDEQFLNAARYFSDYANEFGITAAKAAAIREPHIAGFYAADRTNTLNVHMATSIRTPYGRRTDPLDYDDIDRIRDEYASTHIDTSFVKIFLDGVPTPARTAAMLSPYVPDEAHGDKFDGGPVHVGLETLTGDLTELDRRGYTVKIHTAGDRSVRIALDAIEATRKTLGDKEKRHELAHAGYIDAVDLSRFAQLNAVADLCPVIWHPSPIIDAVISAVGEERGERYWPVRDLLDSGAPLLAGSDWPSAVPDANPWSGIEAFVTRRHPHDLADGVLWPEQAITLEEAVEIYTLHGARAMKMEDRIGSIEVGKLADFIVLERNIFEIPIDEVADTKIRQTWFEANLVYEGE